MFPAVILLKIGGIPEKGQEKTTVMGSNRWGLWSLIPTPKYDPHPLLCHSQPRRLGPNRQRTVGRAAVQAAARGWGGPWGAAGMFALSFFVGS